MLDKLDGHLNFQKEALHLLNKRQEVLAANIANNDTPGYQARDIDFSAELKSAVEQGRTSAGGALSLTLSSRGHIPATGPAHLENQLLYRIPDQPSADGNTVDMDRERVNFADNSVKYQTSLTMINAHIKSMMSVMNQG